MYMSVVLTLSLPGLNSIEMGVVVGCDCDYIMVCDFLLSHVCVTPSMLCF